MTTTVKTVTRQYTPRSLSDLDPKVAIVALVTLLAWVALIILFALGKIDGTTLTAGMGPSGVATLLGYLKTSSHRDLVFQAERGVEGVRALEPAIEAAFPATRPVVDEAEGILTSIGLGTAPASPLVSTGTVEVASSATGGGQ